MVPIRYNVRSLVVRLPTTLATGAGVALVVFVLASALMLSEGIKRTLVLSGQDDGAIVLRRGSETELGSMLEKTTEPIVLTAPGVRVDAGRPVGAGENVVVGAMEKVGVHGFSNVQIRGVTEEASRLRPEVHVVEGRAPAPGSNEAMIGIRIRGRFVGTDLGQHFDLRKGRPVQVVGVFSAGGSSYESEVWVDRDVLNDAYRRAGSLSSVRVRLTSAAAYDGFRAAVEQDKRLGLLAMREREYYERQSQGTSAFIGGLGTIVAVFFAIGAMIGAMITMYGAVSNRQKEIGTLRALGFTRTSILLSFLAEAVVLTLAGGAIGALASCAMTFVKFSMMNFASWSELVFEFRPTPQIIVTSVVFAVAMGLVGGFFPAVRASRVSAATAMRGG